MGNPYTNIVPQIGDMFPVEGFSEGPNSLGLQMSTLNTPYVGTGTKLTVGGDLYLTQARANGDGPISTVYSVVTTINGTPTANESLIGIYTLTSGGILTLVAQSVDMGTAWGTVGKATGTLASGSAVYSSNSFEQMDLVANVKYYIGVLNVATTPVTLAATPAVANAAVITGNSGVIVSSVASAPHQAGTFIAGTSLTALPATVNLGTATITVQTQVLELGAY